jgi:hypothetical protein
MAVVPPACGPQGHIVRRGVGGAFVARASSALLGLGLSIGITIEVTPTLGV